MKYTSVFAIIVLFKYFLYTHSDAPISYLCVGLFTINLFDDHSASWVHRGNDHNLLHRINYLQIPWRLEVSSRRDYPMQFAGALWVNLLKPNGLISRTNIIVTVLKL